MRGKTLTKVRCAIQGRLPSKVVFCQRSSSSEVIFHKNESKVSIHLLTEDIFHQRSSSIKGCLPSKVVLNNQRSPYIKGHLPAKVVFHKSYLPSKVVFPQRPSSTRGLLSSKVIFHQRPSYIKGHLSSKVVLHQRYFSIRAIYSISHHIYLFPS